jgi:hypothetical protein
MITRNTTMAGRGHQDRNYGIAIAEDREERAQGGFDQHPIRHVADAAADPVAERGKEPGVVAEALLRIGEHTGVQIRLALGQQLEYAGQGVHAQAGDQPRHNSTQWAGGTGEGSREGENTCADHAADHHGGKLRARHLHDVRGHGRRPLAGWSIQDGEQIVNST